MCVTLGNVGVSRGEIKFMRLIMQYNKHRLKLMCYKSISEYLKIKENCTVLKPKTAFPSLLLSNQKKRKNALQHRKSDFL